MNNLKWNKQIAADTNRRDKNGVVAAAATESEFSTAIQPQKTGFGGLLEFMKIRFGLTVCFGLLAGPALGALGLKASVPTQLPNYDKRSAAPATVMAPSQEQAVSAFKALVPTAKFERDNLLGVPRLISTSRGYLTGPNGSGNAVTPAQLAALPVDDPHRVIKAFVNEHASLFGHDASLLTAADVTRDYITEHNGMRTVVWQQKLDDVPVFEGVFMGHLTAKGELISISSRFVPSLESAAANGSPNRLALVANPSVSSAAALVSAAYNLGTDLVESSLNSSNGPLGADKFQVYQAGLLRGDAQVQLRWLPVARDSLRLCWRVDLTTRARGEMYSLLVDAETGEVWVRRCLTAYIKPATYNVYTSDSPSPFSPGFNTPTNGQPPIIARQMVTLTALNTNASPNGWINDADNETLGNNVDAHTDKNNDNVPDLPRPQGVGPNRVFNFPLDLTKSPATYSDAAVVNLFYWNNFMHDKLYEVGFTEAAGNFQKSNFGRGGLGNDAVLADAQDGGGTDNANFSTPPDGFPGRMQMYVFSGPSPNRDGDLDAEVMCHEYTHGLSTRLVGGGVGISALQTAGMGEGWSDFYALTLLSDANDDVNGNYAAGGYASYELGGLTENYYYGIRRYPYSTDLQKNPLTFKDIDPAKASSHAGIPISPISGGGDPSEVHAQGEVWCVTLWEARVALVEKLGYAVGNKLILKLVTDGMKLSPQNPTFLEARDAIIQADQVDTGGDNYNELWIAFAKRGMGFSAVAPPSDTTTGVIEAFNVPDDVVIGVPDGILEVTLNPPPNSGLFAGSSQPIFLRVTDAGPVTNATINATINGTNLVFLNDGVSPDATASNAVYSAAFLVPTNVASLNLAATISAPGKDPTTITATYLVIPIPANDDFANATKVPANGATYLSNNKLATLESNEPTHAGVPTASASLWWSYAPTNNGPVLVDTAGSTFNSIVAVYTNASLATLGEVASADDFGTRKQAFVVFDGKAGTTYRIAVASFSPNTTGTIYLNVAPKGTADTNPPVVSVSSPISGFTVATNRVLVVGTAVDPDPVPSGISDITIRVNPGGAIETIGGPTASLITSSNWSRQVGLNEGLNILQVTSTDNAGNKSVPITLQVTYRPIDPINDLFANAIGLTTNNGVSSVNTAHATKEFNEPAHAGNAGGKSAWWSFTAPSDGSLALTTTNSTFDTLLAVYSGSMVSALTPLADNDDAGVGGYSALSLAVRSNATYRIAVDGFDGASGVVFLGYVFSPGTVYNLSVNATAGGQVTPASGNVTANSKVVLAATPNQFFQFDGWTGSLTSSDNPLSLVVSANLSLTAHFSPIKSTDDFETGNLLKLDWKTSGNVPWQVQSNTVLAGNFSARSGVIGNSQTSSLLITTNFGGGDGSFFFKVSSELGWDFFQFYLDGSLVQQWSGEVDWQSYPFTLPGGTHTLEWRYAKDGNASAGLDAAFLDNVNFPLGLGINASTPAQLQILRQPNGSLLLQGTGQTNQQYVIQGATSLTPGSSWQNLSTNVATSGVFQYMDPGTGTNPLRFYRAVVFVP